jgi:hypothetical protein
MVLPQRTLDLINKIYNDAFYKAKYKDIANAYGSSNAISHFINEGIFENRSPHVIIDPNYLLEMNSDLKIAYDKSFTAHSGNRAAAERQFNPVHHFLIHGAWENRKPSKQLGLDSIKLKYLQLHNNPLIVITVLNNLGTSYLAGNDFKSLMF